MSKILIKSEKKRICVVLIDRANYGRIFPVMKEIKNDNSIELVTICGGSMVLEKFGKAVEIVKSDGFKVDSELFFEVEGSNPNSMAKSVGLGVIDFSVEFKKIKPDLVLLIGDRYEALAACIASVFMNIPVAHIQGGEVSGSIDESTRHAITKFSHLHFPSTKRAAKYIIKMGENSNSVFNFGCPSGDYIIPLQKKLQRNIFYKQSVGADINPENPFLLVIFHPVTTDLLNQRTQIETLFKCLEKIKKPTVWMWPNIDAGSDDISKAIRKYRERNNPDWLCFIKNLDPISFQKTLKSACCLVGNSSSFVRDSTFSGVPVVLVGDRQKGREIGKNTITTNIDEVEIASAINFQIKHGFYKPQTLYGKGDASKLIVEKIKNYIPQTQKQISYVDYD